MSSNKTNNRKRNQCNNDQQSSSSGNELPNNWGEGLRDSLVHSHITATSANNNKRVRYNNATTAANAVNDDATATNNNNNPPSTQTNGYDDISTSASAAATQFRIHALRCKRYVVHLLVTHPKKTLMNIPMEIIVLIMVIMM